MFVLSVCTFLYLESTFSYTVAETTPKPCESDKQPCDNGQCVYRDEWCDGFEDCDDNSDENNCSNTGNFIKECNDALHFRCDDGECIPKSAYCDDVSDCDDESDETSCLSDNCDRHEFECENEDCIHFSRRCDGIPDCEDESDEEGCSMTIKDCEANEFKCRNGACILRLKRCNGNLDCADGSDEDMCAMKDCDANEFKCSNGECIPRFKKCNGHVDCTDGSDEDSCARKDCDANEFKCSNGECILKFKKCNGHVDCADGSDEDSCAKKDCDANEFKCNSGECILLFKRCNGYFDCADSSDEDSCRPKNEDIFTIIPDVEEHLSEPLATENAVRWILSQRQPDYAWEEDTPRALIALRLAQTKLINKTEIQLATQRLLSDIAMDLVRNKSLSALPMHKLAHYVTALVASCGNPRNFLGFNLVDILRTQADETLKKEYISPGVFLALCVANRTLSTDFQTVYRMLDSYVGPQRKNGRLYGFESYVAVVAACMLNSPEYNHIELFRVLLNNTVFNYFFNVQDPDVYTISLLVQALNAWSSDPIGQALQNERQILFQDLLKRQRSDGSFGDFLSTYFALPALNGKSLASLEGLECFSGSNIASYYQYPGGEVINTRISLWVTTPYGTDVNSITFHVLSTWTLYDAMELASAKNPLFKFEHEETKVGKAVYRISDLPNDGEGKMYWNLYINRLTDVNWAKKMTLNNSILFSDPRFVPDRQGIDTYVLKENDNIVFWYRPLY